MVISEDPDTRISYQAFKSEAITLSVNWNQPTQPSAFKANALTDYTIVGAWPYCNEFIYYDRYGKLVNGICYNVVKKLHCMRQEYLKYQFLHLYVRILQKRIKCENIINFDWKLFGVSRRIDITVAPIDENLFIL